MLLTVKESNLISITGLAKKIVCRSNKTPLRSRVNKSFEKRNKYTYKVRDSVLEKNDHKDDTVI